MAINVRSIFLLSKFALPALKQSGGLHNKCFFCSIKGCQRTSGIFCDKGSCYGVNPRMAADYVNDKVRVNAICPGTTETPSLQSRIDAFDDPEKAREDFINRQPMKRFGKPGRNC